MIKARALRFVAPRRVEVQDVCVPEPSDSDVVVRTAYTGISSGSEMLAYRGEVDPAVRLDDTLSALDGTFTYPFAYGYSAVGVVERSTGAVPEGSLVFAFHPHQDVFVVPEDDVIPLDGREPRDAVLLPLVETALQACLDAGPRLGEPVVVLGLGCVGVLTAALLAREGADVLAGEPVLARRQAAEAFGVEAVSLDELAGVLAARTGARGATLVVEASGNPRALAAALDLLAREGTALVVSWYGTKPVSLPLGARFHRERLSIRSSQVSTIPSALASRWDRSRRRAAAAALLDELPVGTLATHEFPFERAADAFAAVDRADDGLMHAALRFA